MGIPWKVRFIPQARLNCLPAGNFNHSTVQFHIITEKDAANEAIFRLPQISLGTHRVDVRYLVV